MPSRFLQILQPFSRVLPEAKEPNREVSFKEKLLWTFLALVIYLIMSQIKLYGVDPTQETDYWNRRRIRGIRHGSGSRDRALRKSSIPWPSSPPPVRVGGLFPTGRPGRLNPHDPAGSSHAMRGCSYGEDGRARFDAIRFALVSISLQSIQ